MKNQALLMLIKGKLSDLQKLIIDFCGTTILTLKVGTSGCGGQSACPGIPGCKAYAGVLSIIFVLYVNDLSSKASTSSISSLYKFHKLPDTIE